MTFAGVKSTVKTAAETIANEVKATAKLEERKEPVIKASEFYTGAISRGHENVLGQATRKEYVNEFIDFWKDDYRDKIKCACFLAIAFFTFNVLTPFSLFCVALAAKYWDLSMWNRNIARFNGHFRTIIFGN